MRSLRFGAACAAACLLWAHSSAAAPLLAGATLYPAPGEPDPSVGAPLASLSVPFSAAPLYTGTLTSEVYNNDFTNPYSGLTFVYQLSNDLVSLDTIHRLTINNFSGFLVDASYQLGPGLAPTLINRSVAGTVGFGFIASPVGPGELDPGLTTALLVLQTDSLTYVPTFASVIDGTVTSVASFSPAPRIPEPSSGLLLALGVGALAGLVCRRRRAAHLIDLHGNAAEAVVNGNDYSTFYQGETPIKRNLNNCRYFLTRHTCMVAGLAMMYLCLGAAPALATFEIWFDEDGNGQISLNGGPITPLSGTLLPDPASGMPALTYFLPELVVNGDVAVFEPGTSQLGHGMRFTNEQGQIDSALVTADRMLYFSEQPDPSEPPPFPLADTGFPPTWGIAAYAGTLFEEGPEGNNGFNWFPGGNIYHGIGDVPEPSTLALLGVGILGLVGCAWRRRRAA